jgi:YjbE family integral membrane protein
MEFVFVVFSILLINLVLSGDNAVVIALASKNLPQDQRKKAVMWGSIGAIGLRILLTMVVVYLLKIPYLQLLGGILLVWIAIKLLIDNHDTKDVETASSLWNAVKTIVIADLVMSLDNVLALAAVVDGHFGLLILGLVLGLPFIICGSSLLLKLIDKYPIITYLGSGLIAYTAGEMIIKDLHFLHNYPHFILPLAILTGTILFGYIRRKK